MTMTILLLTFTVMIQNEGRKRQRGGLYPILYGTTRDYLSDELVIPSSLLCP